MYTPRLVLVAVDAVVMKLTNEGVNVFGNSRYLHLLDYLRYLHIVKAYGYGTEADPLNNLRGSSRWGIPPWKGAYLRAEDKANRIINLTERGESIPSVGERENTLDTMADRMAYDGLALVLYSESAGLSDDEFAAAFEVKPLPDPGLPVQDGAHRRAARERQNRLRDATAEIETAEDKPTETQFDEAWLSLSFNDVVSYLQQLLDAQYPADIFPPSDAIRELGRDPGAQFVGTVRAALDWLSTRYSFELGDAPSNDPEDKP